MTNLEEKEQVFSLVSAPNWSLNTDLNNLKGKPRNNLICSKHKNNKLSLLIHEIEGFVIEESNLPFKEEDDGVEEQSVTNNANDTVQEGENKQLQQDKENELVSASTNSYPEDKDELMSLLPTKCKYCGNELPEQRAMWGKRFCNSTCAKKYSVQCSQRMKKALHRRTSQHSGPGRGKRNKTSDGLPDENDGVTPVKRGRGRGQRLSTPSFRSNKNSNSPDNSEFPQKDFHFDIDLDFNFPPRLPLGYGLDEYDVDNELYDGDEPITLYAFVPVATWSIQDVIHFIRNISGCEESASAFEAEEIDGKSLLLLKVEHMVQTMNIKLGPALKIASCMRDLKMEYGIQTRTKYLSSP